MNIDQAFVTAWREAREAEICAVCTRPVKRKSNKSNYRACPTCKESAKRKMSRARGLVITAICQGKLPHPSKVLCADCGQVSASCYDHRDYDKPLEVTAVCQQCNILRGPAVQLVPRGLVPLSKAKR